MAPVVPEEWDLVDMGCEATAMELDFVPVAPFFVDAWLTTLSQISLNKGEHNENKKLD